MGHQAPALSNRNDEPDQSLALSQTTVMTYLLSAISEVNHDRPNKSHSSPVPGHVKVKEPHAPATSTNSRSLTSLEKLEAVDQSLKVLFQCEYYALVEYVKAMIPMLYCVYVTILSHLPSHVYYPETRNLTPSDVEKVVINIFAYAWLEIISFVMMHFSIKRQCGFSPVYLLTFVLENQAIEFQARLCESKCLSYVCDS